LTFRASLPPEVHPGVLQNQNLAVTAWGSGERRQQKWLLPWTCHDFGLQQKDLHPKQTEASSTTAYRGKEADGPSFSPVLPCSSFPPTYTSPEIQRTEGLKMPVFHLAIPTRSDSEVSAVTLQWSNYTLKRQLIALIQLSLKQHISST